MSIRQMSQVWEHPAVQDGTTMLVLLALADWANDEGYCWPSVARIAKRARVSERHVRRILEKLNGVVLPDGNRLIEIEENRGKNHTNRYKLNLTQCPISFGLIPVVDVRENLTSETQNLTPVSAKPDIAMSPEPSRTTNQQQPSEPPTPVSGFNSIESARMLAMELRFNGRDLLDLCDDAVKTGMRAWKVSAPKAAESILGKWRDYEGNAAIEKKFGRVNYLKQSIFIDPSDEKKPLKWKAKE